MFSNGKTHSARRFQNHRSQSSSVQVELMEDRRLLATFGVPWPDARNLSVSFPTDNSTIGAYANSLRTVLDQVADRNVWQETVLRAFQTWAVQANMNIGLVPDRGDTLGTVGLANNDPRFGEFRVGAFPQPGVLASALPYQQIAGTWSGDVLLNTQSNWFLGDWNSGSPITVPAPNAKGPAVELFSVLLHEAGNALGVADNNLRSTVMYTNYTQPKGRLTTSDITAIRTIYGARRDMYEPVANNTRSTATRIVYPSGYSGQTPVSVRGSLNTLSDVDFYRFRPLAGRDKVNVRLWASGISLLKAKLEVFDSNGAKISDVKADSIFENNLQLEIGSLNPDRDYFIRVVRNTTDVFGIGDYRVDLDYRDPSRQPSIDPPVWDADAEDDDNSVVDYVSIDQLFSNRLVSTESNVNNSLATATRLETVPGFLPASRYEAQASLSSATDRDFYRFRAPAVVNGVLNIDVNPVGNLTPAMDVVVMNGAGDRVASRVLNKAGQGRSVQILNPVAGAEYVIGVQSLATSTNRTGNYLVTVDFATEAASMQTMFNGQVTATQSDFSRLETSKSQLIRFDLSASAATIREGVQISIFDARTRDLVFTLSVGAGLSTTEYIWLRKGDFILRADSRTRQSQSAGTISFRLRADVLSDDQGPNPVDPTILTPPPVMDPWVWTDYPPLNPPVISLPPTVIEDPWLEEQTLELFRDYYSIYYG
jgi:hypothetical protein